MAQQERRQSVTVKVGNVRVGSSAPVVVQSMTNTDTADVQSTIQQVAALATAGSELVRVTVNNDAAAVAVPAIVEGLAKLGIDVPIVGDFHYNGHLLLKKYPECARSLAKYRINPGNVSIGRKNDDNFRTMIECAVENQKPVRIGVNWGSLDQALLTKMMDENSKRAQPAAFRYFVLPACVALLLISFVVRENAFRETFRYSLQGIALTPIFFAAVRWPEWGVFRPLNWQPVRFLGTLSYSLYLVHHSILIAVEEDLRLRGIAEDTVALTAAVLVAWVIYRTVEKPCAKLRRRLSAVA